jgi:ADP-ribose pyrophosphatase
VSESNKINMKNRLNNNYLLKIPEKYRYMGDFRKGEIEIVIDLRKIKKILNERRMKYPEYSPEIGIVFEDEYILITRDPVIFPSGHMDTYLRIFEKAGFDGPVGVVILPVCNGLILLRKNFRHATRRWELELPRGLRDKGLKITDALYQEITEEVGLKVRKFFEIGEINGNTGLLVDTAKAYWVSLEFGNPAPKPERSEALGQFVLVNPPNLLNKIKNGEIRDGFTLSVLQLAQAHGLLHF